MVTLDLLRALFPGTHRDILETFVDPINESIEKWEIANEAMFLAQIGHESAGLKALKENLNYSADGLRKTFPKYFTAAQAAKYARKPEAIANRVYANRMGNGDEASGDGWKHRGRGAIQLTGKDNYTAFAEEMEMSVDEALEYMETPHGAIDAAAWFWWQNDINDVCDDIVKTTKRINGGTNGLEDRKHLYAKAQKLGLFT